LKSHAILFDLDGTLIDSTTDTFLPPYFAALTKQVAHLVAPDKFIAQLTASTRAMVANLNSTRTLEEIFAADFFPKIGVARETLMPLFDDFYAREYPKLRSLIQPIPDARRAVELSIQHGYQVIVATMPVFPGSALRQRIEWGGLADLPFALVTDYETMHASKPHSAYYREIAALIHCAPEECVMVGNEIENDILPARKAGMKTFWVTDAGGIPTDVPADWHGTLEDFGRLLESRSL
jgi:FMN phosphatase YigB (HAD superfamily)